MKFHLFLALFGGAILPIGFAGLCFRSKIATVPTAILIEKTTADSMPKPRERTLNFPAFGDVPIFGDAARPAAFVLFLSDEKGWRPAFSELARGLAADGKTIVAGIDWAKMSQKTNKNASKCAYPAGDLESLSEAIQKKIDLPEYQKPLLVGAGASSAAAYATLCQAPDGTFRGGAAIGFCPVFWGQKAFCKGSGGLEMRRRTDGKGFDFGAAVAPASPFEVLLNDAQNDCPSQKAIAFFEKTPNVRLERVASSDRLAELKKALKRLEPSAAADEKSTSALPIKRTSAPESDLPMVVFLSGDGGWTSFDQKICDELAARKTPSLGLNCQSYFWQKKSPEQAVADLAPAIRAGLAAFGRDRFMLVGYSFGANVAPFLQGRLPADLREKAGQLTLLSADSRGDFEIHVLAMLGKTVGAFDVAAEVRSLQNTDVLCINGSDEKEEIQPFLAGAANVRFQKIAGSHSYNHDAAAVAEAILAKK